MSPRSPIPDFYYFIFGAYEPFLTLVGFIGSIADPLAAHNSQAPWPADVYPYKVLPPATFVTLIQLAHVCALLGLLNLFLLFTVRKYMKDTPALQEKILFALFTPLLIGDTFHLGLTLWALGEQRWDVMNWSPMLWTTFILGISLMIPRICWHLGIGRYVDSRDGPFQKGHSPGNRAVLKS